MSKIHMLLQDRIRNDLKTAMRDGNTIKRDVLRMVESAGKNAAIEKKLDRTAVDDAVMTEVLRRAVKQRKDSIAQFELGHREDLAQKERDELAILLSYLPASLDEESLVAVVETIIRDMEKTPSQSDFGFIMGKAMRVTNGLADGESVKEVVQKILQR